MHTLAAPSLSRLLFQTHPPTPTHQFRLVPSIPQLGYTTHWLMLTLQLLHLPSYVRDFRALPPVPVISSTSPTHMLPLLLLLACKMVSGSWLVLQWFWGLWSWLYMANDNPSCDNSIGVVGCHMLYTIGIYVRLHVSHTVIM